MTTNKEFCINTIICNFEISNGNSSLAINQWTCRIIQIPHGIAGSTENYWHTSNNEGLGISITSQNKPCCICFTIPHEYFTDFRTYVWRPREDMGCFMIVVHLEKMTLRPCFNHWSVLWFQSAFAIILVRVRPTYRNKEKVGINHLF